MPTYTFRDTETDEVFDVFISADGCKRCKTLFQLSQKLIVDEPSPLSKLDLLESELRIKRLELEKETERLNREILKAKEEVRLNTVTCNATDCAFIKLSNGYVVPGCNNHHNCNMSSVVKNGNAKTEIKIATIRSRVDKISWFNDDMELKKYISTKETSSTDCGMTFYCIEILLNPMNNFSGIGTHEQGKKLFDDLMGKVIKTLASSMIKSKNDQLVKILSKDWCVRRDSCSNHGISSKFINCNCQYAKPYIETIKKQNYVGSHLDFKFSYEFENKTYEELFKTEILKSETSSVS